LALGDHDEVDRLLDWLEAHPPGHIPVVLRAERLRVRARLLSSRVDPAADDAFAAATKALRDLGSPYHLAVGLVDHAQHREAVGEAGGAELLAEAVQIAQRLRAQPLLQRASLLSREMAAVEQS
jgi:hypothetical protein